MLSLYKLRRRHMEAVWTSRLAWYLPIDIDCFLTCAVVWIVDSGIPILSHCNSQFDDRFYDVLVRHEM